MFNTREQTAGDTGEMKVQKKPFSPDSSLKATPLPLPIKFRACRFEPRGLYIDLAKWLEGLDIQEIISHQQSESNGYVTISIFYR